MKEELRTTYPHHPVIVRKQQVAGKQEVTVEEGRASNRREEEGKQEVTVD